MSLEIHTEVKPDFADFIEQRDFSVCVVKSKTSRPSELAGFIEELETEDQVIVFRLLPREDATEVFEYLPLDERKIC